MTRGSSAGHGSRICHVITALSTGGAQRQLERLVRGVPATQLVVSLRDAGTIGPKLRDANVRVEELGLTNAATWPAGLLRLRRLIRHFDPHLLQGWLYHGNLAATAAAVGRKLPVYWNIRHSVHALADEPPQTRRVIRASVYCSSRPRVIVYNSGTAAGQHEALGYPADARRVIPNGFDLGRLQEDPDKGRRFRRSLGIPDGAPVLGMVARYHPMKNHEGFLAMAADVARVVAGVNFVLAGYGVDENNRALAERAQVDTLRGKVHLLGERNDLLDLYSGLDVLCCPSSWGEAFPNVVGEAMACGVPCVVTDVGDSGTVVGDTGFVVAPRDHDAMVEAVIDLLRDRNRIKRLGAAARQRMETHYGLDRVAAAYSQLWTGESSPVSAFGPVIGE